MSGRGFPAAHVSCGWSCSQLGVWCWGRVACRRFADLVWAGQAARAGGPHPALKRLVHSCSRCQASGRCKVMWPRPCLAMRAATSIRSRRIVAPRAVAWAGEARAPAARVRLCAIAARERELRARRGQPGGRGGGRRPPRADDY